MQSRTPAAVEAGTGVGKSYAYLTKAMHLAAVEGRTTIVSTAMKSLQQQLFFKDLPRLQQYYPDVTFARKLGKKNYGCRRRADKFSSGPNELRDLNEFFGDIPHWVWGDAQPKHRLPMHYPRFSVDYCSKTKCDWYSECADKGYLAAREEAAAANILVVNHALIAADIRVYRQHGVYLLPDADHLVVDEAHKFVESVREALGSSLRAKFFATASSNYDKAYVQAQGSAAAYGTAALRGLPDELPGAYDLEPHYQAMFAEARHTGSLGAEAMRFANHAREVLKGLEKRYHLGTADYVSYLDGAGYHPVFAASDPARAVAHELDTYYQSLKAFAESIDCNKEDRLRHVLTVSESSLVITPLEVAPALLEHYGLRKWTPLYMSATLTVNGQFNYFTRDVGLKSVDGVPARAKSIGSPFDYEKQARGYYPSHLPEIPAPRADEAEVEAYYDALVDEMWDLLLANEGHAFVLLTSHKDMEAYRQRLESRGYPYPLLVQRDEMKARARDAFLETPNATLLGLKTFWEGIDIPGLHLSLVIIPKLPFPNPADRVLKAKSQLVEDGFGQVLLPSMITDLKQMAGRLIRTVDDLGVVAVLDKRIATKRYGSDVIRAIGFTKWTPNKSDAVRTLQNITVRRKALLEKKVAE